MKKNLLLEHTLERNAVICSTDPINVVVAQRHLYGLLHAVETAGRFYDLMFSDRIVGRLQGAPDSSIANA